MTNNPDSPWLARVMRSALSVVPASLPATVYRLLVRTPMRPLVDKLILSMIPATLTIDEGVITLDTSDVAVSGPLALGAYEKTEVRLFREALQSGMTVVDIGAHIGYYTVIAGNRVGPLGRVFAFEPEERNFSFLERNLRSNELAQVTAAAIGLADAAGERLLYLNDTNKGHYSLGDDLHAGASVRVTLDTLDHALAAHGSPAVDVIKLDVEGAEALVLAGMRETLASSPRVVLFTEFYPAAMRRVGSDPRQFLEALKKEGFSLSVIDEDRKTLVALPDSDAFFAQLPKGEVIRNLYGIKTTGT